MPECPKCRLNMAQSDRVCRRCKYIVEEGRYLQMAELHVPENDPPRVVRHAFRRGLLRRDFFSFDLFRRWRGDSTFVYLASLIPGVGHMVCREVRRGVLYCCAVAALVLVGIFTFGGIGQALIGLAACVHTYSIYELTPQRQMAEAWPRAVCVLLICLVLQLLIYVPLSMILFNEMAPAMSGPHVIVELATPHQIISCILAGVLVLALLLGITHLHRRENSKEQ